MSRWKIAWRSIQQRALASSLTGLSMALGVMLVVAVLVVHGVIDKSFLNNSGLGYNMVVGAKGGRLDLVLNTVYYLSRPVENIPYTYYLEFTQGKYKEYVDKAIPVCLGDMYQDFRVIGTTADFFDELDYGGHAYEFAAGGRNFRPDEYYCAVIGSTVARETGLEVGDEFQPSHGAGPDAHTHDPFKIVGILKPTGTPNDRGLFINMEGFYLIPEHAKPIDDDGDAHPTAEHEHAHAGERADEDHHEHAEHDHKDEPGAHEEHADDHDHDKDHAHEKEHEHDHEAKQPAAKNDHADAEHADHHEETDGDVREKDHDPDAMPAEDKDHDHEHADEHAAGGHHDHGEHAHADHDEHGHHHEHGHAHGPLPIEQREVTAVLVLTASVGGAPPELLAPQLMKSINKDSVAQAVLPIREMTSLFSTFVDPLRIVLLALTVMIVIVSGIGILVSIYNSMNERQHEIAVIRALGAGRRTVMGLVLMESILLSLAGGLAGWIVGHVLIAVLSPWIVVQTGVSIGFMQFVGYELVIIPGLIVLAALVGYLPAMAAYRTDVAKALERYALKQHAAGPRSAGLEQRTPCCKDNRMTTVRPIGLFGALAALMAVAGLAVDSTGVLACPFCSAVSLTFSEEINNSAVAVVAKLVQAPPKADANSSLEVAKARFEIIKVLKGEEALGKNRTIETVYFGDNPAGSTFLIMGIDPPTINWGTPIAISERGIDYVAKAMELPKEGADRLVFFQDYLEDSDEMLARDAYDEFAKAPYSIVLNMKDRMKHDKVIEWVKSTQIPVSRRRLYMTMLGVCGKPDDLPMLEEMIKSKDRQTKGALDALVAAYLTLKGPDGMPLVEELFLKNKDAEYTDTYATIMALRFHGTEEKIIPKERLLEGFRAMLDRPQLADLVIPDLARWEDWSVMDRLVALFKNADDDSNWVRVPVINYLRACPRPEAKERLDELAKLDPETFKRANAFFPLAASSAAPPTAGTDKSPEDAAKAPAFSATGESAGKTAMPPGESTAALSAPPANDTDAPPAAATSNLPVFGGLAVAAVLLACAFWVILKGGQRTAS